jgi:hypothetical protein
MFFTIAVLLFDDVLVLMTVCLSWSRTNSEQEKQDDLAVDEIANHADTSLLRIIQIWSFITFIWRLPSDDTDENTPLFTHVLIVSPLARAIDKLIYDGIDIDKGDKIITVFYHRAGSNVRLRLHWLQ